MLCLSLFLLLAGAEESQASQQASCVPNDLLAHVEDRLKIASVDRWTRIKNALIEQPNAIALSEVKSIVANRKANGWNLNRLDEVVTAMECLAQPEPAALESDDVPQACVSPELQSNVEVYSKETWHGAAHVERWLRVLQTFSGTANDSTVMTPAEAQEMADRWSNGRWNPVVAALQCLETEALNESVEVEVADETAPMPQNEEKTPLPPPDEDPPQPLNAEENQQPSQSDPIDTSMRVYFHASDPDSEDEYRINEDDHWEAELIIHYESNQTSPESNDNLCVNTDIWGGNDYWNNGPITLPGFNDFADLTAIPSSNPHPLSGGSWRCTGPVNESPYITVTQDDENGVEFVYRATVRTRDNNVVENDFSVAEELQFIFADATGTGVSSGSTIWRTETDEEVDRSWWRMLDDEVAWPGDWSLGDGSAWHDFTDPTCSEVAPSKYIDRAPANRDKTHADYIVRANVDANVWLPDHCFPTEHVPKIPPTPPNTQPTTFDNTSLPIIEEDDVSWVTLREVNNRMVLSLSKPVMTTEGNDCSAEEELQLVPYQDALDAAANEGERAIITNTWEFNFSAGCDLWWKTGSEQIGIFQDGFHRYLWTEHWRWYRVRG